MARGLHRLPLEKPIYELEDKIADLETAPLGKQSQDEVQQLRRECADLQKQIFSNLDPWQTVEVARHPNRPKTSDYLDLVLMNSSSFTVTRLLVMTQPCSLGLPKSIVIKFW